jgi:predicted permease
MTRAAAFSIRLYRWLARALPEDFLRLYGREMILTGEDTIRNVTERRGWRGLAILMLRLIVDLTRRLPREHMSEFVSDIRLGVRTLASSKGMVLAVALSTGLAIALIVWTYNEISIVFRSVPGTRDAETLFTLQQTVSYPDFERYSNEDGPFVGAAAYMGPVALLIRDNGHTERVWGQIVTPSYFETLKISPAAGRMFSSGDDRETGNANIVISEGYWQHRFGGATDVLGRTLKVNGQSATITGIAAKDFFGASPLTSAAELWISTNADPRIAPELAPAFLRDIHRLEFHLIGRLKSGITPSEAQAQLDAVARQLEAERGDTMSQTHQSRRITVLPGGQLIPVRKADLPLILAAPATLEGLVLLLACANAATLLLAKTGSRTRELTIRAALGASRRRMIKQLLTETLILGIPCGVIGLTAALVVNHLTQRMVQNTFPPYIRLDLSMRWTAILFGFSISMVSATLCGVVPAFKVTRVDLLAGLKTENEWFLKRYRWFSSRNILVLLQITSSTMLLVFVAILAIGFQRASNTTNVGFDTRDLYTFSIDPLREGYSLQRTSQLLTKLPDRLREIAGIDKAALSQKPPMGDLLLRTASPRLAAPDRYETAYVASGDTRRQLPNVFHEYVGPGYFEVLSVHAIRGRTFGLTGRVEDSRSIVINETLAKEGWPSGDAIGRHLEIGNQIHEVIGVVNDFRSTGLLANSPPVAFHLLGPEQVAAPPAQGMTVVVRANPGVDLRDRLQQEFATVDPNLTVFDVVNQTDRLKQVLVLTKFQTLSYGLIGVFGLILAAVGLAGVTAYAVGQRWKEIGIRVALGATPFHVLRLVSGEGACLIILGILIGQAGALGITRILNASFAQVYEVTRTSTSDPLILIGAPALLAALTMISSCVPAHRALQIDPVSALRQE